MEDSARFDGLGMRAIDDAIRGSSSSISSGSGGCESGERNEADSDWSERVWWARADVNAVCAVMSLPFISNELHGIRFNEQTVAPT